MMNIKIAAMEDLEQIMKKLMEKNGFVKSGRICVKNGTQRIAYQWADS